MDLFPVRHMSIGRDLREVGALADQVNAWVAEVLDDEGVAAVELALVEAVTNAIRHGSAATAERISVFVETSADRVVVEIEDSSPPMPALFADAGEDKFEFDPEDIDNIPEGGRGMSLIVLMMDEVGFRQVGDHVRLRMSLAARPASGDPA